MATNMAYSTTIDDNFAFIDFDSNRFNCFFLRSLETGGDKTILTTIIGENSVCNDRKRRQLWATIDCMRPLNGRRKCECAIKEFAWLSSIAHQMLLVQCIQIRISPITMGQMKMNCAAPVNSRAHHKLHRISSVAQPRTGAAAVGRVLSDVIRFSIRFVSVNCAFSHFFHLLAC